MRSGYSKAPVDDNSIPLIQNTYNTGAGGVGSGAGSSRLSRADPMDRFRRYEEVYIWLIVAVSNNGAVGDNITCLVLIFLLITN